MKTWKYWPLVAAIIAFIVAMLPLALYFISNRIEDRDSAMWMQAYLIMLVPWISIPNIIGGIFSIRRSPWIGAIICFSLEALFGVMLLLGIIITAFHEISTTLSSASVVANLLGLIVGSIVAFIGPLMLVIISKKEFKEFARKIPKNGIPEISLGQINP